MKLNFDNNFKLTDTVEIPCIGYGTWQTPSGDVARECVKNAIKAGYRHIDTAAIYGNEEDVGTGIIESGVSREKIFLTTKHWISERGYEKTLKAVDDSLKRLKTDYIDLYLIHWPCVEKISPDWKEINASTWAGFEKAYKDGKIRALGVSNFLPEHILALEETAEIKPCVNQIEFHPGYYQPENVKWCIEHGMTVEAWSPMGSGAVLNDYTLNKIAKKYNVSAGQVCIRFALQSGVLPLPKSTNADRMKLNLDVFGFELSEEDMLAIRTMPPVGYSTFHPTEAPADAL